MHLQKDYALQEARGAEWEQHPKQEVDTTVMSLILEEICLRCSKLSQIPDLRNQADLQEEKVSWKLRHAGDEWHPKEGLRDAKVPAWVLTEKPFSCILFTEPGKHCGAWSIKSAELTVARYIVDKSYNILACCVGVLVLFAMSCSSSQHCHFTCLFSSGKLLKEAQDKWLFCREQHNGWGQQICSAIPINANEFS